MAKGNIPINKALSKEVENGKIVQTLPLIGFEGQMYPLFTPISPIRCSVCGNPIKPNENYSRSLISSYGIISCPTTYWICSNPKCRKHHTDMILGITGSANYSDEYLEKQKCVRYNGHCSLWDSRIVCETFTEGLTDDNSGRAPCPTTLWNYEQKQGKISAQELSNQEITFSGTLYIDGYWVKSGWQTYIESQLRKKLTPKEWKKIRNKVIYVVATEDKVVLDFQITNHSPSYLELVPLLKRIRDRIPEKDLLKIVSDEDTAIIGAVKLVFPNVAHSFCVFHQLKNLTEKYLDVFGDIEKIPLLERELYELAKKLIFAETSIESSVYYHEVLELASRIKPSRASKKIIKHVKNIYFKNIGLLKEGFTPETNNTMEQLFSLVNSFIEQARSFKTKFGLSNFCYNLFTSTNKRCFNTGKWSGFSPLDRAKLKFG
ncbi:MAG: transposase [Euryarchaeota archaeon]|nr:transposase [Euryarchaeota archaeon]